MRRVLLLMKLRDNSQMKTNLQSDMKKKDLFLIIGILILIINKTVPNENTELIFTLLIIGAVLVCIGLYKRFYERK